ncbi:beta-L-arabinofuranosidase domain-containing protein [Clostridium lacusfryxellense]|uniref:beta-L-arabinofuranosidase domain-containing protein n=1 Tax=Clostridium lacusfryxellense TaxID=205328 RepID=UPI0028AE3B43|nr:beta-L-arabinofuranosidase domain-containing protein [Clostridium lacusfryxellense]
MKCESSKVYINGEKIKNPDQSMGYLIINMLWSYGDEIELVMDMPVKIMHENPKVKINL